MLTLPSEERIAFSTDSFVVQPIEFPGGTIGHLAVHGTVNDLAVSGARPQWLSAAFVIEEGFMIERLRSIVADTKGAADAAGVLHDRVGAAGGTLQVEENRTVMRLTCA